jgi:cysteinyl-tRNA synthetase
MSKSLGNFFTIRDVLEKYHPEVVRYLIVSSHYRSSINYSEENLIESKAGLDRFYQTLRNYVDVPACELSEMDNSDYYRQFIESMNDDFNTRIALAVMYDLVKAINTAALDKPEDARALASELKAMANILGILQANPIEFLQGVNRSKNEKGGLSNDVIETLVSQRLQAKKDKQYARADEIRQQLDTLGIVLEDSREGTAWRRK